LDLLPVCLFCYFSKTTFHGSRFGNPLQFPPGCLKKLFALDKPDIVVVGTVARLISCKSGREPLNSFSLHPVHTSLIFFRQEVKSWCDVVIGVDPNHAKPA
jgi:hypothetical protein